MQIAFLIYDGKGTLEAAQDPEILDWVREAHAHSRFSTSVCTGSPSKAGPGLMQLALVELAKGMQ